MTSRRSFLGGLAAGALPLPAFAQTARMQTIGYLGAESPALFASRLAAFRDGLAEAGFVEGRNVAVEYRWADGRHERLAGLARELADQRVDVIAAPGGAPAAIAAKAATRTIPIVFEMGADPVRLGLVESLSRPGGNLTGVASFNVDLAAKRLALLHEAAPRAARFAVLVNPTSPTTDHQLGRILTAATGLGITLQVLRAGSEEEFEQVFEDARRLGVEGLVVASDTYFATHCDPLAALARHNALPAIHQSRDFALAGGLMSYGGNFRQSHRQAGVHVGRVLKGERPASLPVHQVTNIELLINLGVAKALGLAIPPALLAQADEVIE